VPARSESEPPRRAWDVRLSFAAEMDLENIVLWTAGQFGEGQARTYESVLKNALSSLREGPSVAGARPRPEIADGLYSMHAARSSRRARHFIFFHVVDDGRIEVVRVLHDGMDFQRHLSSDAPGET
jgi:toxin ParE1/3/4